MSFILSKISDHGTSNPIVARTFLQVADLLQPFAFSEEKRARVIEIHLLMVQPRLLRCMEVTNRISAEIEKINIGLLKNGIDMQPNRHTIELPYITQLQEDVETFLYNAKSVLRDFALLFDPFFMKSFDHSRYNEILKWATGEFGEEGALPKLLNNNQEWIKDVVNRRNAIEHPGGYSGHLHINNYQMTSTKAVENKNIVPPTWHLNSEHPTSLLDDLSIILNNLLEFGEYLLIACLQQYDSTMSFVFYEIPKEKRNKSAPIRFGVTLDTELIRK